MKKLVFIFARYISYIFVPPSFTFLIFLMLGLSGEDGVNKSIIVILLGLFLGLIIPIIFFTYLMKKGKVGDSDATIKEERLLPYMFGVFISAVGMMLSYFLELGDLILNIWLIYFANMILLLIINKFWKISAHAIGVSLTFGILFNIFGSESFIFFPLIILIGWSRIYLKKHTFSQVIAGILFGFTLSTTVLHLFWKG